MFRAVLSASRGCMYLGRRIRRKVQLNTTRRYGAEASCVNVQFLR